MALRSFHALVITGVWFGCSALAVDPRCSDGIPLHVPPREGDACCAKDCGACGGAGCGGLPGGAVACCASDIKSAGRPCDKHDPPCVISGSGPSPSPAPHSARVTLELSSSVAKVAPEYLSFNIDASTTLKLQDKTLDLLASSLAPAHLRVGGTQQDYNVYAIGADVNMSCDNLPSPMTGYRCKVITEEDWTGLLDFVERNNLSLVFGLNDMFGRPTKTKPEHHLCGGACPLRNQDNLMALLRWTRANRPTASIYGWELGNELNTCLNGKFGAMAQASDFIELAKIRDELWNETKLRPKLIGPDTHSSVEFNQEGLDWWADFVHAAKESVDAFTFHMYALGNGPALDATRLEDSFLNPEVLDRSRDGALALKRINIQQGVRGELWCGESSSANNGGQRGITDTYINGFWYLDQLGSHAISGVSVFQRQVLASHGGYPMIDLSSESGSVSPRPDFWTALLHKRLMGQEVLNASSSSKYLRAYAHCAVGGGISVALINIASSDVVVKLDGGDLGEKSEHQEWILTAGAKIPGAPNALQSYDVQLNGVALRLQDGPMLPSLPGREVVGNTIRLPATTYAFVRFPGLKAEACTPASRDQPIFS